MTTTTETKPTTQAKEEVVPLTSIYTVVEAFVKADNVFLDAQAKKESKYWPMVDEAIKQIESGKDPENVRDQFYSALKKAHGYGVKGKRKDEKPSSREHTNWLLMTGKIIKLAKKGQAWIEEQRKAGTTGFWPMAEMIVVEESTKKEAEVKEVIQKDRAEAADARAFKKDKPAPPAPAKPKTGKYKKAAERLGIVTVKEGKAATETNRDTVLESLIDHPDRIVPLIEDLLKENVLSKDAWEGIIETINTHLKGK